MLGISEGQGPSSVEIVCEGHLGVMDSLGPVLARDFGEVWEFREVSGGGEAVDEDCEERI